MEKSKKNKAKKTQTSTFIKSKNFVVENQIHFLTMLEKFVMIINNLNFFYSLHINKFYNRKLKIQWNFVLTNFEGTEKTCSVYEGLLNPNFLKWVGKWRKVIFR